jgi:hypothetical protein
MKKVAKALVYGVGAICAGAAILFAGFKGGIAWTLGSLLHNEQITSSNVVIREIQHFWGRDSVYAESIIRAACTLDSSFGDLLYKN